MSQSFIHYHSKMYILLVFVALGSVSTHDITVGSSTEGKKIFDEHFEASPAVWRQAQNVTINTTDDEVISRIVVTDLREDKNGDAKIVDGGEGQKKVTIELKSPTLLRGYDFNVEVYAAPNKEFQNGPLHPSELKTNAGSLNTPGSKTPQSIDVTTRLPETPKTQGFSTNTEVKPGNARATRDAEVKKQEENKPKIESPPVFGFNKAATTVKSINDSNVPVTVSSRLFTEETEDNDETIKSSLVKDKKVNEEVRHVRDTHDDDVTTKNTPKIGSFDSQTITTPTTRKTPSFNKESDEARHVRETHDSDVTTKNTPRFGSFDNQKTTSTTRKTPSFNKESDEARHVRDTREDDVTTKNTPKIGSFNSATTSSTTTPKTLSFNKDEARHTRDIHDGDVTTKNTPRFGSFDSTTSTTSKTSSFSNFNRNNPVSSPSVLIGNDNRDARATQKDVDDENVSTTLKPTHRNPTVYTPNFERNVPLVIQNSETDKNKPQNDNLKNLNDQKRNVRDTIGEAKEINTPITDNVTNPTVTYKNAENTTEERKSRSTQEDPKITPFSVDVKEVTTTTASTFVNKQNGGITDGKSFVTPGVFTKTQNYPVPYPYETTKIASSTNSPHKRDTETSQAKDDKNVSLFPKSFGSQNSTSHDLKTPVVSLQ